MPAANDIALRRRSPPLVVAHRVQHPPADLAQLLRLCRGQGVEHESANRAHVWRQLLPGMLARNSGRILFISSESGVNVPAEMVHYGATKAAMLALGNGLAKLTRGTAVTVNSILGGPTYSQGVATAVEQIAHEQGMPADSLKAAIAASNQTSLLQRFIEPDEIANLAVYLASPLASATNGAALRADGGVLTATL